MIYIIKLMNITKEKNDKNNPNQNIRKDESKTFSKFKILYKEIQNEIKNIVIIKLHNQISKLIKEINYLKKENVIIKNDLIYILKRVLINKNEYNIINSKNNNMNNISSLSYIKINTNMNYPNNSSLSLNKSKNSFVSNEKASNIQNNNNQNSSRTKISLINTPDKNNNILFPENNINCEKSKNNIDKNKNKYRNINNKIDKYLNNLYRQNFKDNHIGYENNYNLNKSKSVYDELFNTQGSIFDNRKNNNNNSQKKTISSFDDINEKVKAISAKKIKKYNQYKNLNIKLNKFNDNKKFDYYKINVGRKEEDNLNNIILEKNNKTNRNLIKKKDINNKGNNIIENNNNNYGKKSNSRKINIIKTTRSPFIVNKF